MNLNLFKRKASFQVKPEHKVIPAFKVGSTQFYQFEDVFNMPCMRGLGAIKFYEEFMMRCTREYLMAHYEANKNILSTPVKSVLDLKRIWEINEQLGERLRWVVEPELLYKFASVVFFDGSENPYEYDMSYNVKKIERWKKEMEMKDFFLQQPMLALIPYLRQQEISFPDLAKTVRNLTQLHLENLLANISSETKRNDLRNSFGLPMEMPQESTKSNA